MDDESEKWVGHMQELQQREGRRYYRKSTGSAGMVASTNCEEISRQVDDWKRTRRRRGKNKNRADLDRAVLTGLVASIISEGRLSPGGGAISGPQEISLMPADQFFDNISGEWLRPDLVKVAREEEMAEVRKHRVYEKG